MTEVNESTRRFCGSCGTRTTPGASFCGSCGSPLSPVEFREAHVPPKSPAPSWADALSGSLKLFSGRDVLMGVSLSVLCAAFLVAVIYALLFARGVFEDPLVPKSAGLAIFALMHGGAISVDVPQVPELFGLGGSAKLGLPVSSFVLFPFVAALLAGRFLARGTRMAWVFVLSAALSYAALSAVIAALGTASVEEGGATIRLAADWFSTATRGFLWIGLAAMVSASAASGPFLPARVRQVLRGTLVAVCAGVLLTVAISLVVALAQGGAAPDAPGVVPGDPAPGGSWRDALSGIGAIFTLMPAMLGNSWLFAHGLPVGLHGATELGEVPFLGEALADVPLSFSLLGEAPFGWEWRLLLAGPALGVLLGGMVAAGGASRGARFFQGASVAVPYTIVAALVAVLVGVSAEVSVAGASFDLAFRASLAWMPVLLVAGAILGGLGGLLAGEWSNFAPRPNLAFATTAALGAVVLVGSLPLFAATSAPQNPLPTDPMTFDAPLDEPTFEMPEEPEPPVIEAEPPDVSPEPLAVSPDSPPNPAFDALLPTLRDMTTAPIMLPADLPAELRNTAVDAAYSGDEYGILFLAEPTGNIVEQFVRAYTAGTLTASPSAPEPSGYFEATSSETVVLSDGTEATLRYMEPTMDGGNAGPYWEGEFERDGYVYRLTTPLADPSGDIARQTLSSMVEAPNEGGEIAETGESVEQEFITDYYEAVSAQDWAATYSYLDYASRLEFTEDEWISVQRARHDASGALPVESAEITNISGEGASFTADVLLTYTDGGTETVPGIEVYFEDGGFRRHLSESDVEFLRDIQNETGYDPSTEEDYFAEEISIEDTIYSHYEAIGMGDFTGAYSYFGPTFRSANDEATWVADEESFGITDATVEYVEVLSVSGDTATAAVDVSFEDDTGTPSFSLVWDLVKEGGIWKLDSVSGGEV